MLPRRFSLALACAGAAGALLVTGLATLPAAAAGSPGGSSPAPQADPSPTGIVVLPTTAAPPPPTSDAPVSTAPASTEPASTAPATHSAAPTSGAARSSRAAATGAAHATSSAPVTTHTSAHAVTSTTASSGSGGSSSSGSTGGSNVHYYSGPVDLPTDLAASPGAVALVTSKAPGGKPVLVPATSTTISASDRKVGSFSLSSVLITTVVAAAIVALLGGVGLWLTHRFGTRLSQTDPS